VPVVLSFDVEEHFRIEAAAGIATDARAADVYAGRMRESTLWILDLLAGRQILATFFFLGKIAEQHPDLVRRVHDAGHEVGSHGWDHRRLVAMTPDEFREDLRMSMDALQQATGAAVLGYRAPTFSLVRRTAWAIDVLVESGIAYDSSIYPVRHDRYGIPDAPRDPFLAQGPGLEILEIPPASCEVAGVNLPVGGGGYFRLLPYRLMGFALRRSRRDPRCRATMLYFHPWEFDPQQPRLPLRGLNRFRTYVGVGRTRARLTRLTEAFTFQRAIDVARALMERRDSLPRFRPQPPSESPTRSGNVSGE